MEYKHLTDEHRLQMLSQRRAGYEEKAAGAEVDRDLLSRMLGDKATDDANYKQAVSIIEQMEQAASIVDEMVTEVEARVEAEKEANRASRRSAHNGRVTAKKGA